MSKRLQVTEICIKRGNSVHNVLLRGIIHEIGRVVELADTRDSKSRASNSMRVRFPPRPIALILENKKYESREFRSWFL